MRDAEALQPYGLQGNGLLRVLGGGPSSSAERPQADGARVTPQRRPETAEPSETVWRVEIQSCTIQTQKKMASKPKLTSHF